MHDTRVADMPHTALPMTEVQEALDGIVRAQCVVVFVDTCHAAGLRGDRPVRGLRFRQNPHALPGLSADLTLAVSTK